MAKRGPKPKIYPITHWCPTCKAPVPRKYGRQYTYCSKACWYASARFKLFFGKRCRSCRQTGIQKDNQTGYCHRYPACRRAARRAVYEKQHRSDWRGCRQCKRWAVRKSNRSGYCDARGCQNARRRRLRAECPTYRATERARCQRWYEKNKDVYLARVRAKRRHHGTRVG